jgi:hypothetical protein
LKLERIISSESNESTVRERLAAYFAFAGYTQAISEPHLITYRRGKFLTLTAKGCKVNAVIQISPSPDQTTQVTVTLDIDTTGQYVFERERKYWRKEMDDIEQAILKGKGN